MWKIRENDCVGDPKNYEGGKMGQMLPFVDFNGTRWAMVGP